MMRLLVFLFLIAFVQDICSQNTVGVLTYDNESYAPGYNLFFSHNQSNVYLIDACGEIVHEWIDEEDFRPGNAVYLLPNSNLVKCKRHKDSNANSPIFAGGAGETIEVLTWDNQLLSSITLNDSIYRLHHDVAPMPNGNILAIAWKAFARDTVLSLGRTPSSLTADKLWSLSILEWDPTSDDIVWEWNAIDHVIQDFDSELENFGNVSENPQRIDINYYLSGIPDWLHTNSIDYNPVLDQIAVSVPHFDELWIIDHSTNSEEVKTSSGGNSGRGGNLLYRWGNPITYKKGDENNQKLFFQHDVHWINPLANPGDEDFGKLMLFNNRLPGGISTVNTIITPVDGFDYSIETSGRFGPSNFDETFIHPDSNFMAFSGSVSSAQKLANDNILVMSGRWGFAYEITPEKEIAWEYRVPFSAGQRSSQGDTVGITDNLTFRMKRYAPDYPAFDGKDLSPKGYLEMNPNESYCEELTSSTSINPIVESTFNISPNPFSSNTVVKFNGFESQVFIVRDLSGRQVLSGNLNSGDNDIDLSDLGSGIYFIGFQNGQYKKIIKL